MARTRSGIGSIYLLLIALPVTLAWASPSGSTMFHRRRPSLNQGDRLQFPLPTPETSARSSKNQEDALSSFVSPNNELDPPPPTPGVSKWFSARRLSVSIILASSFLNLLGFTMAGPITPALGNHFNLEVGASFGSLTSAYPLGMLAGLFLWPQLSDRIGRKPVMAASLVGSSLGLALQSLVIAKNGSLALFLASRVLTGSFAGSSPVAKAYLADLGFKDGNLPRYLALRDAASTMAFIIGPVFGGLLYELRRRLLGLENGGNSLAFVIAVSAVASLFAGMLVAGFVKENPPPVSKKEKRENKLANESLGSNKKAPSPATANDSDDEDNDDDFLVACPLGRRMWTGVASVCVVSFLFNVGDSTFHAFFSALLRDRTGVDTKNIGLVYTLLACVSFSVSATTSSVALKRFGPVATCAAGMSCVGAGLLGLGLAASGYIPALQPFLFSAFVASAALYYCGVPLYGPTIPTMLLRCVPSNRRGAIMGLDGAINTIARVISPLVMGDIYRRYGPAVAFGVAGVGVFGGVATTLYRRFVVLSDRNLLKS